MALLYYKSIIQSKFDYCDIVWGSIGKGYARKLQILQNRALRSVMSVNWTVSSDTVYNTLKVDKLEDRRIKRVLHFMYKIVYDMIPQTVRRHFVFKRYNYSLRRTEFKRRSISYYGTKLWNNIMDEIKIMSLSHFKRRLDCDNDIIARSKGLLLQR